MAKAVKAYVLLACTPGDDDSFVVAGVYSGAGLAQAASIVLMERETVDVIMREVEMAARPSLNLLSEGEEA